MDDGCIDYWMDGRMDDGWTQFHSKFKAVIDCLVTLADTKYKSSGNKGYFIMLTLLSALAL